MHLAATSVRAVVDSDITMNSRARKSAWVAAVVFIPMGFLGLVLINYSMGYAVLSALGMFLVMPLVAVDRILDHGYREEIPEVMLWTYFIVAEYLWIWGLVAVAVFALRRIPGASSASKEK